MSEEEEIARRIVTKIKALHHPVTITPEAWDLWRPYTRCRVCATREWPCATRSLADLVEGKETT